MMILVSSLSIPLHHKYFIDGVNNLMSVKHSSVSYTNYFILALAFYQCEVLGVLEHSLALLTVIFTL